MTGQVDWVEEAIAVMEADLAGELQIPDLAAAVYVSRYHFARTFTAVKGISPGRYRYRLRMAEACRLLATTDLRVLDVAVAVGYGSCVGTFGARFRAYAGCTPLAYRKATRQRVTA